MPVISIAIQKGGSGKTTTAINLAAALVRRGKTVLLIDADPQSNLSQSLGFTTSPDRNLLTEISLEIAGEKSDLRAAIKKTTCGLEIVSSSIDLATAELELVSVYGREQVFSWMLQEIKNDYDYIIIDCPPAIGLLTVNALVASDYVLMPLQAEFLSLKGVEGFMHHFKPIKKLNRKLEVLGFVFTKYDERKIMNRQSCEELERTYGAQVFETRIRTNIQLAVAQKEGLDIFSYDEQSHGAQDYNKLANEVIGKIKSQIQSRAEKKPIDHLESAAMN